MKSCLLNNTPNNPLQLLHHQLIINDDCNLLTLLVVLQGLRIQAKMLVFGTNVVIDDHLHVESIESFGSQRFFLCLIGGGFDVFGDLDLDVLDVDFGFVYHF